MEWPAPNADGSITVGTRMIGGGYLRAIRAPLVAGAWCPPDDGLQGSRTAMVNRRFVDVHAPNQNLVGRSLKITSLPNNTFTITGVVGDLAEDSHATSPVPYSIPAPPRVRGRIRSTSCGRRTRGRWPPICAGSCTSSIRRGRSSTCGRCRTSSMPRLDQPRLDAAMLGLFAGAALPLAAIGLYSLFMLVVSESVREMAVRLAIGAAPGQVIGLVLAGAGRLLAAGFVAGIALTAGADRLLRGVLFGVGAFDVPALGAALITIALVSLIAVRDRRFGRPASPRSTPCAATDTPDSLHQNLELQRGVILRPRIVGAPHSHP